MSAVLNTLERSIKTPSGYSPFSKDHVISLVSWSMACSVELLLGNQIAFNIEGL